EHVRAQLPQYRNAQAQSEFALDVLLGAQPGTARQLVAAPAAVPTTDKKLLLSAPASVIANRPDILSAERMLASAT
ncbi:TolC family protein, partial [Escherichia coli]